MFLSKSFIKAFRTFSTKLHDDGLCFSRCCELSKSVVILCLTLTVCLGEETKSKNGCVGNYIFNKSVNKCIECPPGFVGTGCIYRCPDKKYGQFCLSTCSCPAEQCNAITGCSEGTTTNDRVEGQNKLTTLSTEFTHKNSFTSNILTNSSSSSPMAGKTVENNHRTSLLITVAVCRNTTIDVSVCQFTSSASIAVPGDLTNKA
ncbi:uncharacterized protein LOC111114094 isoform X2 [Crassostrea virginica]